MEVQIFGVKKSADTRARRYRDLGLHPARYTAEGWLEKLSLEPLLLRMPLVRWQQRFTLGHAEGTWRAWMETAKSG